MSVGRVWACDYTSRRWSARRLCPLVLPAARGRPCRGGVADLARHHRPDLAPLRRAAVRAETFKFSTDPELEGKIRDVVGLYLHPPEKAVLLCVEGKPQLQALERTAPV